MDKYIRFDMDGKQTQGGNGQISGHSRPRAFGGKGHERKPVRNNCKNMPLTTAEWLI